jgi:YHS domain-containing protein
MLGIRKETIMIGPTTRRTLFGLTGSCVLVSALPALVLAGDKPARLAIKGYDPVAYFNESRPVKGRSDYESVWEDVRWHFASEVNRDLFRADPERYAPQYLGHCSMGIAEGDKSEVDPEAWAIVDGKLYLNGDLAVRERWEKNRAANINQADANWPALRNK